MSRVGYNCGLEFRKVVLLHSQQSFYEVNCSTHIVDYDLIEGKIALDEFTTACSRSY
jgi:hypothetical protein